MQSNPFLRLADSCRTGNASCVPGIVQSASCAVTSLNPFQSSCYFDAQRVQASPLTTEPVKGGAGRQGPILGASVSPSAACAQEACLQRPRRSYRPRDRQVAAQASAWPLTFNSWEEG